MPVRAAITGLFILSLLSSACSVVIGDLEPRVCATDEDCQALGALAGLPVTCFAQACRQGRCERLAAGVERQDGLDNDCDGLIDEPGPGEEGALVQTLSPVVDRRIDDAVDGEGTTVAFAADDTGGARAAWVGPDAGDGWTAPLSGEASAAAPLSYRRGVHEFPDEGGEWGTLQNLETEPGCYQRLGNSVDAPIESRGDCNFSEVAIGLASPTVLVAAINASDCIAGQLRIGSFESPVLTEEAEVLLRGPWRRSNSYLGVDLSSTGACTGGSRPGCTDREPGACGASRPTVAILGGDRPTKQALVGWRGGARSPLECGDGREVDLEVVVAYLRTAEIGETYRWIEVSGEGATEVVGRTAGAGPPAIAALEGLGYLVAFGDAEGRLALRFIEAATEPPDNPGHCEETCDGSVRLSEAYATPPLSLPVDLGTLAAATEGAVDFVTLAVGEVAEGEVTLGLGWREGCGTRGEVVVFREVVLSAPGGLPEAIVDRGEAQLLSRPLESSSGHLGPPAAIHLPRGFVVEGFERGGLTATANDTGGWLVAWAERADAAGSALLLARRVAQLDGQLLDEDELLTLSFEGDDPAVEGQPPGIFTGGEGVVFSYRDGSADALVVGRLSSPPAEHGQD